VDSSAGLQDMMGRKILALNKNRTPFVHSIANRFKPL
jgi:hypothetical protein